ncbi:MAG: methylmalonyl-CoA carboxyltransferase, partial [Alphaproteobacteria bacterium]|nr:methylmalonyl-CoA carboxyltransferase [Alphaproteobacteria bacterium]
MAFEDKISEHERRSKKARAMGSPKRLKERADAGILNARERLEEFLDKDSFSELGLFAHSYSPADSEKSPADGVVTGYGKIDGRMIAVSASDFTTLGASSAITATKKYGHLSKSAQKNGIPIIHLGECSGARMPEIMGASGIGGIAAIGSYNRRRKVPYASAVLGQSYGGSTWNAVMSDFVVMRKGAVMAVSSNRVTTVATAEEVNDEELGGWMMQTGVTGQVDLAVNSDLEALSAIKRFLSYLPSHNGELPPVTDVPAGSGGEENILELLPEERSKTYDVRKIIKAFVDKDSYFPLKERFGKAVVTALTRLNGQTVGIVANNPKFKGGALDADSCDKICAFLALCDSFNVPLVLMADTPGFLIGVEGEKQKIPGKIMNFLQALELCTVPKLAIVMRKSFGQAYLNMGGGRVDEMAAWFTGEIGFVDPAIAVSVVHGL